MIISLSFLVLGKLVVSNLTKTKRTVKEKCSLTGKFSIGTFF